jgi:hypothetical protein
VTFPERRGLAKPGLHVRRDDALFFLDLVNAATGEEMEFIECGKSAIKSGPTFFTAQPKRARILVYDVIQRQAVFEAAPKKSGRIVQREKPFVA